MMMKSCSKEISEVLRIERSQKLAASCLQWSSSVFAVAGGVILASNTQFSGYGFFFLALSSSQMLVSSILVQNISLTIYSGSLFLFVDCLGIYRWILR
jgi:hypothetical protein